MTQHDTAKAVADGAAVLTDCWRYGYVASAFGFSVYDHLSWSSHLGDRHRP